VNSKLWVVVRREYLERVRTKGFVIATVLGPVLMAALMVVPLLVARSSGKLLQVAVLDETGTLGPRVEEALGSARFGDKLRFDVRPGGAEAFEARQAELKKAVLDGRLDGYLHLPKDVLTSGVASYYGRNVSNRMDLGLLERSAGELLVGIRLSSAGLDPARVKDLTRPLDMRTIRLSAAGEREDRGAAFIFSIILMMILYTSILMWGQLVMTSVIEEKTSRVIEVMASGLPASQLLWGKLLGVGAAGLTQFLVWALSLFVMSVFAAGQATTDFKLPEITPLMLVSFVLFFLLGFFFYAALYASIGAAVNTVQEAQNFVFPIVLPLVIGMVCFPAVIESPDGGLAITLSMVPFLSPLMMFLRIVVLTPPWWQIGLSFALLALAIVGAVWMAARIYRVGILMYGKKPTFPELVKWVKHA
jgi:ABC-2 type transport system permease protein